jgi:diguanylate cyclase (GGDEF)-like protein
VYCRMSGGWTDEKDNNIAEEAVIVELSRVLDAKQHWRPTKSKRAMFPLADADAVVSAVFHSSPAKPTRDHFQDLLHATCKRSSDAFDANHDSMTGLLNARAFFDAISAALTSQNSASAVGQDANAISSPIALAVFALDIDFFKQVNDTFGHPYGDVVIRSVARCLEQTADTFARDLKSTVQAFVARPSGEEFLVLVVGPLDLAACNDLGERLRSRVAELSLPGEDEVGTDAAKPKVPSTTMPPSSERKVSVSVGFATTTDFAGVSSEEVEKRLRRQADAALYRAKIGGRNTVRNFDDILLKYGTVIEHHEETDVVCVDLGRDLGCAVGREFLVYHPTFTGVVPFVLNDGRTRKVLGKYPRIPMGRIVVVDSQRDISFCEVRKKECPARFPPGSLLQAVPLGSISHLLSPRLGAAALTAIGSQDDVRSTITSLMEKKAEHVVLVARIRDAETVLSQRGTGFMNDLLAALYEVVRRLAAEHAPGARVNQINQTEFVLVFPAASVETLKPELAQALSLAASMYGHVVTFVGGAFHSRESQGTDLAGDKSSLDPSRGLDYARYAAALAATRNPGFELFTPPVAAALLQLWRDRRKLEQAEKDYTDFRELGIANAQVENTMACLLWENGGDTKLLDAAARQAVELAPKSPIFHANRGVFQYAAGAKPDAFASFQRSRQLDQKDPIPKQYLATEALSAFESWKLDRSAVSREELLKMLLAAKGCDAQSVNRIDPAELDEAVSMVSGASAQTIGGGHGNQG